VQGAVLPGAALSVARRPLALLIPSAALWWLAERIEERPGPMGSLSSAFATD
jgi:hypothetical protein